MCVCVTALQGHIKRIIRTEKGDRKTLHNCSQLEERSAAAVEEAFKIHGEQVGIKQLEEGGSEEES